MDLLSLSVGGGYSLNCPAGHQLSPANSLPSVSVTMSTRCDSSGRAIGQRWCVVDREADSDSEYYDASSDVGCSDDDYFDALEDTAPPTVPEQEIKQKSGDGPWQIVTRRKSRRKGQHSPVTPAME